MFEAIFTFVCLAFVTLLVAGVGALLAYNGLVLIPSMLVVGPVLNWFLATGLTLVELVFGVIIIGTGGLL